MIVQLAERGLVSALRFRLEHRKVVCKEPGMSFLVSAARTPTTIKPVTFFLKMGKVLLRY
jgi:hypothetical protein